MPKPSHRDKLIESGLAVFHEHGFHATGVQSIVDHAGVPKGSFYNHFKSKDDLGLEILHHYWKLYASTREDLKDGQISVLKRIDRHLAAFGESPFGCLIGNFSSEMANSDAYRQALGDLYAQWISDLSACIKEGQTDGTIQCDDTADNLAEFVITALEGAILKKKVSQDPSELNRLRRSISMYLQRASVK